MSGIDPEVLELAREEANERVANIEHNLLGLEDGSVGEEAIDALFRDAHSIKSAAAMLGWNEAVTIAHSMEDTFDECREGNGSLRDLIDPLLKSLDAMKVAVSAEAADVEPSAAEPSAAEPSNGVPIHQGGRAEGRPHARRGRRDRSAPAPPRAPARVGGRCRRRRRGRRGARHGQQAARRAARLGDRHAHPSP
jgi:two-component system chemotaxis sensor kinase CheA